MVQLSSGGKTMKQMQKHSIQKRSTQKQKKRALPKVYVLKPVMTDDEIKELEGTYFDEKSIRNIIDHDADVYAVDANAPGGKRLLAKFRKNVFSPEIVELAWDAFHKAAAPSRNRGAAAGPIDLKSMYWKKRRPVEIEKWSARYIQNGKASKMRVNNNVFSSVLGYFEKTPFMGLPCRLTSYTQTYFKNYKKGLPFIQAIDRQFKTLVPESHKKQLSRIASTPAYQIADTAFSSVTINRNFRTALHQDAGDFREGFGNLSVVEYGKYHGGFTVFPQYSVGFDLRSRDFIAMDVHQWHCNTALYETDSDKEYNKTLEKVYSHDASTGTKGSEFRFSRISFVCYVREKLIECKTADTNKYYNKIQFDPMYGKLGKEGDRADSGTDSETDSETDSVVSDE